MPAYSREEIISSSFAAKNLGGALEDLKKKRRLVISRNNRLEAVILPIEEYEEMIEDLDHILLALEIRDRKDKDTGIRISWEAIKAKYGL